MKATHSNPDLEISDAGSNGSFRELIQVFLERLWLIVAITVLAVVAGATYAFRSPPVYQSKLVLEVEQDEKKFINIEEIAPENLHSSEMLNTIAQTVKNSSVLKRVIQKNNLVADRSFWSNPTNAPTEEEVLRALSLTVNAKLRRQTRLIDLSIDHTNRETAQKLVASIADEYVNLRLEQRIGTTQMANKFLFDEADKLKAKLTASERAVQAYKEKNKTVSLEERQNIDIDKLKEFNQRYTESKSARLQLEVDFQEIHRISGQPERLLNLQSVANHPSILAIKNKIFEWESNIANLTQRYREKHPTLIEARNQLKEVRASLDKEALNIAETIKSEYKAVLAKEESFKVALAEQEGHALEMNQKAMEFNTLAREVESDRIIYDSVMKRLKETDVTKGIEKNNLRVAETASLPVFPIKPQKLRIILVSFLGSFVLSLGLVHLLQQLDSSIKSVDSAERILGLPVLGAIPKHKSATDGKGRLVTASDPQALCSEAFRTLRATVSLLEGEQEKKVMLFTSAVPADGKTFCSVNYAVCLAQQGHRTLVIDLDLRKPSVAESFALSNDGTGVSNYLLANTKLEELVRSTAHENVFVLTAGPRVPNPAELLSTKRVEQLLQEASQQFDKIVIDTPPVNAVSDALSMIHLADTICVAARAGKTSSKAILRAIEVLRRSGSKPSGVILNCLTSRLGAGYYYYYYGKKPYGNGGVYGSVYAPAKPV